MIALPAGPEHAEGLQALFRRACSSCFCRYWHFEGDKSAWLARLAGEPEKNERELAEALRDGSPSGRGVVAVEGHVVGWMKLAPRQAMPKLRQLPVYRGLDLGCDAGVLSIGCFLIDPAFRRRGVARALTEAALQWAIEATELGATAVEAYPRRSSAPLYDEEAFMGPESMFQSLGFNPIHEEAPYPVYRKELNESTTSRLWPPRETDEARSPALSLRRPSLG